ncbi:MAG: hypothetical protein DRI57_18060 [Deltaproteobacteria bacterium]|nr:MAG: hypothetical protein DRI57_18060 [Deltaproteobacteria bacterium]
MRKSQSYSYRYAKKPDINRNHIESLTSGIEVQEFEMIPKMKREFLDVVKFPSSETLIPKLSDPPLNPL